jgi:outer membrane protein assembly factor BamB
MTRAVRSAALTFAGLFLGAALAADDWPQWRGPRRDGVSRETGLLPEWPPSGPPLAWKASGAGDGFSSLAVAGGAVFTMGAHGDVESVLAFDAASGRLRWKTPHGTRFRNGEGDGPRGTPTVDGGRLYALGAGGDLSCLDAATGRIVWTQNVLRKLGGRNIRWGLSESPLVVGDRVLVNVGARDAAVVAFDARDGSVVWKSQSDEAGYASAVAVDVGGIAQAIFFTGERALGLRLDDGGLLWEYRRVANGTANIATPIVRDGRVFLSSDYGTGSALLALERAGKGVQAREVYFTQTMRNHQSTSVLVGDHLYGFSGTILTAMRFADGTLAWKDRSVGKGSLAYADGRLYVLSRAGVVALVEASPAAYSEKGRFRIDTGALPTWGPPVVAGGRLYFRDQDTIYAYDVRRPGT